MWHVTRRQDLILSLVTHHLSLLRGAAIALGHHRCSAAERFIFARAAISEVRGNFPALVGQAFATGDEIGAADSCGRWQREPATAPRDRIAPPGSSSIQTDRRRDRIDFAMGRGCEGTGTNLRRPGNAYAETRARRRVDRNA